MSFRLDKSLKTLVRYMMKTVNLCVVIELVNYYMGE